MKYFEKLKVKVDRWLYSTWNNLLQQGDSIMSATVTVRIPNALRPQAGNQDSISVAGVSVKEVLGTLTQSYPELRTRLYKNEGELNRFINIYINDEDIRFLENLDTPVKGGDELSIVPAIAGG
jgi:molybdopterin converting factor small subunit